MSLGREWAIRDLTDVEELLLGEDAKNYHAWAHR